MKQRIKNWLFALLRKDPEAVVVSFRSGPPDLADAMCREIRALEPSRRHFEIAPEEAYEARRKLRRYRIGLAPVLFTGDPRFRPLRRAAFWLAPRKILAYNSRLERFHLRLSSPLASFLFLKGVPLDRIHLRPRWLIPWRKDRTTYPAGHRVLEGRAFREGRKVAAVLTPYFPFPLAHGGAVRIFNLLREIALEFDLVLYAFTEAEIPAADLAPVLQFVSRVYLVGKPRYREPRWSTFRPPEVGEYDSPEMRALWRNRRADVSQVEYTTLARYGGDVLVEHDITFDLYSQIYARRRTRAAWWDLHRWQRFETRAIARFPRVVVMSEKDRELLKSDRARVIPNGVDLARYEPAPETPGRKLLFIGSFRHFPNAAAFRFLMERIFPLVPDADLTVVAGPEPDLHWRNFSGTPKLPEHPRLHLLGFVSDVRPLYREANLALIPTLESAGTNVKVIEALAMGRAVVSTKSGCAGLDLEHGVTAWIADSPEEFANGIRMLLEDDALRARMARAGLEHARKHFDSRAIGRKQRSLLRELAGDPLTIRGATPDDLPAIAAIRAAAPEASQWDPVGYLAQDCRVALAGGRVAGFLVARQTAPGEREILNLAVDPAARRRGIASRLLESELEGREGSWFLEVRESNQAALRLYESLGFQPVGRRENYYDHPPEAGIVMRILS